MKGLRWVGLGAWARHAVPLLIIVTVLLAGCMPVAPAPAPAQEPPVVRAVSSAGIDTPVSSVWYNSAGLTVYSDDHATSKFAVTGSTGAVATGPLTVTGAASVSGLLTATGGATTTAAVATGPLTVTGAASVSGLLTATGGATTTAAVATGALTVTGNATASGKLLGGSTQVTLTTGTLTPAYNNYLIDASSAITLTMATTCSTGHLLTLAGNDAQTITIADTRIRSTDGNAITLGQYDAVALLCIGNEWWHVAKSANQ